MANRRKINNPERNYALLMDIQTASNEARRVYYNSTGCYQTIP